MKAINLAFSIIIFALTDSFSQTTCFTNITLSNSIQYIDTSFTDLPGNGFLIDIGDEVLAVTCKHALWVNRSKGMQTISFDGKLKEWKMYVINDPSQYLILGSLINVNSSEVIGERNTDRDYLVFKVKANNSRIKPLKLSSQRVNSGDTLYQVGWTYGTKTDKSQVYEAIASKHLGSSLLANPTVRLNYAGLSGSPVINLNNELVAIVSSWRFDFDAKNWFNAPCSIDYLWQELYLYWLDQNKKQKGFNSFQEFFSNYKKLNGSKPEISSYLYTELFFADWLKAKGYRHGSLEKYSEWTSDSKKLYGISITPDNYRKSLLIFEEWKEEYINGKKGTADLLEILADGGVHIPDYINFCEFAQKLSTLKLHDKAVSLLLFADENIQHMGQLYAYLGDVYFAKGDKQLAKESYEKCLKTYPEYPLAADGLRRIRDENE